MTARITYLGKPTLMLVTIKPESRMGLGEGSLWSRVAEHVFNGEVINTRQWRRMCITRNEIGTHRH